MIRVPGDLSGPSGVPVQRSTEADPPDSRTAFALTTLLVASVFCVDSFVRVPVPGVNEPHYLCKARAYADPDWCSNDFFLQSSNAHAVFYAVVGPLTQWLDLHSVAVIGRIVGLTLLAIGWTLISRRLSLSSIASVTAAALFCGIAATGNFSGEWVVGGFESKVPAYGFALTAVAFWLDAIRGRERMAYAVVGFFAGVAVAFHPVVGLWFCIGIAMSECGLCLWGQASVPRGTRAAISQSARNLSLFGAVSFIVSLPGLWPALELVAFHDATPKETLDANLIQVFYRLAHHLDPTRFPAASWIHTGILFMLVVVGGTIRARRASRISHQAVVRDSGSEAGNPAGPVLSAWTPWLTLLAMSAIIAVVGVGVGWHSVPANDMPMKALRASLLKLYAFRFFDAVLPMSVALLVAALGDLRSKAVAVVVAVAAIIISVTISFRTSNQAPNAFDETRYAAWQDACSWLRENTPQDAMVFTPRESFGMKWFAERSEYICFKDCPQDAKGILEWNRRLWTIHRWSQQAYQDKQFDDADLESLYKKTGIAWLITRRLGPFEREPVFQNEVWRIYEVRVAR